MKIGKLNDFETNNNSACGDFWRTIDVCNYSKSEIEHIDFMVKYGKNYLSKSRIKRLIKRKEYLKK